MTNALTCQIRDVLIPARHENFVNLVLKMMALVNNLDEINSNLHQRQPINNRYTRRGGKKPKVENSERTRISVAE